MTIHVLSLIIQLLLVNLITVKSAAEREIILVYIGSSNCDICNSEENKDALRLIINTLENKLENHELITVGISLDTSIENGSDFLQNVFGDFKNIIVGDINYNMGYNRYINGKYKGKRLIPQVLILSRSYTSDIIEERVLENEKLLYRLVGLDNINDFVNIVGKINFENFDLQNH